MADYDETESNPGSGSLLVVHGRDFKPEADPLTDMICSALRSGIARDYPEQVMAFDEMPRHLAYYGDLSNALLASRGKQHDPVLDLGDRCNALNALRAIPARKRFGIRQYDGLPGKSAVPEFIADLCAPVMGLCGLTMPLISSVSKDFAEYLAGESSYAEGVRARLREPLCRLLDKGDRILLLAHGTGSVVAYDVLWQLSHDERFAKKYGNCKVDTLVTMGSPLGDKHVRKRLLGALDGSKPDFPTNLISWSNVSAEDDYTCHDNTLADDFKGMLQQRIVSTVRDYAIYNLAVRYGRSNPHSSVGYYIHPRISKIVVDWLQATRLDTSPNYIL